MPENWAQHISDALKGRKFSPEHMANLKKAANTSEIRELRRKLRLGKKASPATRYKLSLLKRCNQNMLGKHQPQSQKDAVSKALTGIKRSDKTKAYVSDSGIGLHAGEDNPAWKGGVAYAPYCPKFNITFKNNVRKFFNNTCILCGKTRDELKRNLDIHHVNFDKMTLCNDAKPLFATLCRSCHSKTRFDAEHYETLLTEIITTKFNGQCYTM
jgi:hypothetical protein